MKKQPSLTAGLKNKMNPLLKAVKVVSQLGLRQTGLYALYKLGLRSGHYTRVTLVQPSVPEGVQFHTLLPIPDREKLRALLGEEGIQALIKEADVVVEENCYHQFGGPLVPIDLSPRVEGSLLDWTAYETGKAKVSVDDIKFIWEPSRFGWAVPFARAYWLTGDDRYARKFWDMFALFRQKNPYSMGPNWQSGQEVAVRLVTVLLCAPVFLQEDEQAERHKSDLLKFIVEHASRIPPTLVYARSQHNNHLITEALGLLCAGFALPQHPQASEWLDAGIHWLEEAFLHQITDSGEYIQYSNNYHRVMLQCAVLAQAVLQQHGQSLSNEALGKIKSAVHWLVQEVDVTSGQVANYGHNDGAYLFPFANGGYADYRPVIQTAANLFFEQSVFPSGQWDEMAHWFNVTAKSDQTLSEPDLTQRVVADGGSWAKLRGTTYHTRPGHADQNHMDLWWQGQPIALDAGTYRYNATPPWDNQLMITLVHNTITVDDQPQMTRAGRFLWLDWSTGKVEKVNQNQLTGVHNGYLRHFGILHYRNVENIGPARWLVEDKLVSVVDRETAQHDYQLHWLLPDLPWEIQKEQLILQHGANEIVLSVRNDAVLNPDIQLCRAGQVIYGGGTCIPQMGWYSPTYSVKQPALSFVVRIQAPLPVRIISDWKFLEK